MRSIIIPALREARHLEQLLAETVELARPAEIGHADVGAPLP
jgi:hypothetical protein